MRRQAIIAAFAAVVALLSSGVTVDASTSVRTTRSAATLPAPTLSFYVYGSYVDVCGISTTTDCPLYGDGAAEPVPPTGGMTVLDFGAPCFEPATLAWGAQLFHSQSCTPDSALSILAQAWLRGYANNPNRSAGTPYILALGTSNSLTAAVPGYALTGAQMAAHGQAWFTSLVSPVATVAQSLPSPVTIWAGNDIEQARDGNWYDGPTTAEWVDGYAGASGATKPCVATRGAMMVDYGDYVPGEPGWSPGAVYHVAWGAAPACPMPEIYSPGNADEWESLNRFAVNAGLPQLEFTGVLSEDGAAGSLSSSESWQSLRSVSGQAPPYLSVIGLAGLLPSEVPDAPTAVAAVPGPGLVTLTWSAPAWDGGAAVTAYTVSVYAGPVLTEQVTFSGFPVPETVIVAGLATGTQYTFFVSAANRIGTGPQSLPSRAAVPTAPFHLR